MEDPYSILGISPGVSDEELTQAYRRLAKKYHPDINPGNKNAELKMREINAAYEQIKKQKSGGVNYEQTDGSYGKQSQNQSGGYRGENPGDQGPFSGGFNFWFGDFGDFFGEDREQGTPEINQARALVEGGRYRDALLVLSRLPNHTGEWFFYSALANAGTGNRVTAISHAREAVRIEPGNMQYRSLLNQFERNSFAYREAGEGRGFSMRNLGSSIFRIILAQLFCLFCCRPC
ncbi:J domain-containing protein [Treponema primitia]|uniref:J domain-containing protein n=1 Tax=Treponema primitia TaxID=88058 RepID=UPI000255538A|nr:DnaJ domain-containing protein [Treponema primitia]